MSTVSSTRSTGRRGVESGGCAENLRRDDDVLKWTPSARVRTVEGSAVGSPRMDTEHDNKPGIQRREMLRRAAVVGGSLLWAVPAVQTLAPRAMAQASPVFGCCECRNGARGRALCNGIGNVQCTTS